MLYVLIIILIVILSPAILMAGIFSLFIIFGVLYTIIAFPIGLIKKLINNKEEK